MDAPREAFIDYEKNRLVEKEGKFKAHLRIFLREIKTS
jgi:hypothetical protein